MRFYDVNDWYWHVAGDKTRAFHSKTGDYVPAKDAAFQSFLADGNTVMNADDAANMGQIMEQAGIRPVAADVLEAYKVDQAIRIVQDPHFKLTFALMQEVNALKGLDHPSAEEAFQTVVDGL